MIKLGSLAIVTMATKEMLEILNVKTKMLTKEIIFELHRKTVFIWQNNITSIYTAIFDPNIYPHPSPAKKFFFFFDHILTINIIKVFFYCFSFLFILYFVIILQKSIVKTDKNGVQRTAIRFPW